MNCKNCDASLNGQFCANCGQEADTNRITFKYFLYDFFHAFTHTDKGILLLIKDLITRPGIVAREYLDGKRKKYFNPLSFLVIVSSLYAYIGHKTGYFEALTQMNKYNGQGQGQTIHIEVMGMMDNNGKIISLFLMPLLISFFSWLFFIRSKNNLTENLVMNSFVLGQIYIIAILVFIPAYLFLPGVSMVINNGVFHVLMLGYLITAYKQFFNNHLFFTALKALLINILFIVFFWVCIYGYVIVKHALLG